MTAPIINSLTLLFTYLSGIYFGESKGDYCIIIINLLFLIVTWIGIVCVIIGVTICLLFN